MAATRYDRGNPWASHARLKDDHAPIMVKVVVVPFADNMSDWELGNLLSAAKLQSVLTGHFASAFCNYPPKDPFREMISGVLCWRSFFFGITIVASPDGQRMCNVQKCCPGREELNQHVRALNVSRGFECPGSVPWTSPQVFLPSLQVFVTYWCGCYITKTGRPATGRHGHPFLKLVPLSAHFLSK